MIAAFTVAISSTDETLTPTVRSVSPATKYLRTTPTGTMTWSSGSWKPLPPFG